MRAGRGNGAGSRVERASHARSVHELDHNAQARLRTLLIDLVVTLRTARHYSALSQTPLALERGDSGVTEQPAGKVCPARPNESSRTELRLTPCLLSFLNLRLKACFDF